MYIYKLWFQLVLELIRLICLPLCIFVLQLVRAWIDQTYLLCIFVLQLVLELITYLFAIVYISLTTCAWIDQTYLFAISSICLTTCARVDNTYMESEPVEAELLTRKVILIIVKHICPRRHCHVAHPTQNAGNQAIRFIRLTVSTKWC